MIQQLRKLIQKNLFFRKIIGYHLASSGLFDRIIINYKLSESWNLRIEQVLSSNDNYFIPRVKHAGMIRGGKQVMHNGIKIYLGSYYGPEYAQMLVRTKGVHEPQEERVFQEILNHMPANATMIEMGAFWSFYSMWFQSKVPKANNFMIEPDAFNLGHGKRNFKLNKFKGEFTQAFIGKSAIDEGVIKTICVDSFIEEKNIKHVNILHSDIQGFELDMLKGAKKSMEKGIIDFIFISTHSNEIHYLCLEFLLSEKFHIVAQADLNNTFSVDGLIVASSKNIKEKFIINISQSEGC
jgi:hypothetical protein